MTKLDRISETLGDLPALFWGLASLACVGTLGIIDYLTGRQIFVSFFYLIPIAASTWLIHRAFGVWISVLSVCIALWVDSGANPSYSTQTISFWNAGIELAFFLLTTCVVTELKKSHTAGLLAARTDYLTGAVNARYFNELLQGEVERIRRYLHPITVVYIDIDNFKAVNDRFGHGMGDEVLRCIVRELRAQLRSTDVVARLGGDEFAILLPSTRHDEARLVISKVHTNLLNTMRQHHWPVTFSMGAVTYMFPPGSVEQLINTADQLMYKVKHSTKNGVRFDIWAGEHAA